MLLLVVVGNMKGKQFYTIPSLLLLYLNSSDCGYLINEGELLQHSHLGILYPISHVFEYLAHLLQ